MDKINCQIDSYFAFALYFNCFFECSSFFTFVNVFNQSTKNTTILVLYSDPPNGWSPAMLTNSAGEQEELTCFERDDKTYVYNSCFVTWNNQLFVFGGYMDNQQISRLTGHKLQRVGNLTFDHEVGACSVMANQYIFLCFSPEPFVSNGQNLEHYKLCRRSTGPLEQFSEQSLSKYDHHGVPTSSSDSKL